MARRVFFSFHYGNDVCRANQVRNSWVTKPNRETAGFIDKAEFEEIKKGGDAAIKRWIDKQLEGTSVTVVLIGSETSQRPYCQYELQQSFKRGNGIIGVYIHNNKDLYGNTSAKGSNNFGVIGVRNYANVYFSSGYKMYDWVNDNGYENLGKWIEDAAKEAGR